MGDIGVGLRNIAWLGRLTVDYCVRVEFFFEEGNQLVELDGALFAEVEDVVVAVVVVDGGNDAVDDVVDVGVIAACSSVAEDWDWF